MSWEVDGSEAIRVWPYHTGVPGRADIIQMDLTTILKRGGRKITGGKTSVKNYRDHGRRNNPTISVYEYDEDAYDQIELIVDAKILHAEKHRNHVKHPSDKSYPGSFVVEIRSDQTRKWFYSEIIDASKKDSFSVTMILDKQSLRGKISVTPLVIVNEDLGDIPLDNKARMMGSILAYGANAEIQVDQPSASTGSSIRSVWENFEEKGFGNALFRPEIYHMPGEAPTITMYWNDNRTDLREIIDDTTTGKTKKHRRRDLIHKMAAVELAYHLCEWASTQFEEENPTQFDLDTPDGELASSILSQYSKQTQMTVPEIATSFLEDQFEELSKLKAGIQNYFQLADAIELGLGVKN